MSNSASPSRNILIPFDTHITARHPESVEPSVFLLSLAYFHQRLSRDLPIPPLAIWPSSRDKILDLYKLYCLVLRLGGITVVCRDELWNILLDEFSEAKNEEEKEKDRHFLKRAYWEYLCTYEMYAEWCRGYVRWVMETQGHDGRAIEENRQ